MTTIADWSLLVSGKYNATSRYQSGQLPATRFWVVIGACPVIPINQLSRKALFDEPNIAGKIMVRC
jgi:hypothetical protein